MEEPLSLSTSLDNFLLGARKIKEKLEDDLQKSENAERFLNEGKLEHLKKTIPLYKQIYLDMKVYDRPSLEKILENFKDEKSVQEFYKFEKEVNEFLAHVDSQTGHRASSVTSREIGVGDLFPRDLEVLDVTSSSTRNTDASLFFERKDSASAGEFIKHCIVVLIRKYSWLPWRKHIDELEMIKEDLLDESCSVLVVGYGDEEGGRKFVNDTGCSYPVVTDQSRNIYKLLRFIKSVEQASNSSTMSYFGAVYARGETPPKTYDSDDINQMGGNFVVTRVEGSDDVKVTHIHRSKFTIDRPPVRDLLKHVVSLNK